VHGPAGALSGKMKSQGRTVVDALQLQRSGPACERKSAEPKLIKAAFRGALCE